MHNALHAAALLGMLACGSTGPGSSEAIRVLFIGNSLTYSHDIPALVAGLQGPAQGPAVQVSQVAFGGFSLEDHWQQGDALDSIARGGWDVVVMQQGPSSLPANRQHLIDWAGRFAERIRAVGARPAMYMVWPSNGDYDGVSRSYTDAAVAIGGMLIPAGEAFRAVLQRHPDITILESDEFHPNATGSYLAALVIYGRLANQSMEGASARRPYPGLSPADALELERAADAANREHGRD
jgi:hypothetical protein